MLWSPHIWGGFAIDPQPRAWRWALWSLSPLVRCDRPGQNCGGLEFRPELAGRAEQGGLDPQPAGRVEVLLRVVNHQCRLARQAETGEEAHEDGRVRFRHSFPTGDDGAVKPTEERKSLQAERIRFAPLAGHR